jgi:hypothetical protein
VRILIWLCAVCAISTCVIGLFKVRERAEGTALSKANTDTKAIADIVGMDYLDYVDQSSRLQSQAYTQLFPQSARSQFPAPSLVRPDPWGNSYIYETNRVGYRIISLGKDGRKDTADDVGCSRKWGQVGDK